MTREEFQQTAKDIILELDKMPADSKRAEHKFNMIQIAERTAAGVEYDPDEAQEEILAAASFAGV